MFVAKVLHCHLLQVLLLYLLANVYNWKFVSCFRLWDTGISLYSIWHDYYYLFLADTEKDWEDIKFGVENKIDFYAVSFVKDAQVVHELKDYLRSKFLNTSLEMFLFHYCLLFGAMPLSFSFFFKVAMRIFMWLSKLKVRIQYQIFTPF